MSTKRGQNNNYEKPYFQPLNNQPLNFLSFSESASTKKNIARKAKRKRKNK